MYFNLKWCKKVLGWVKFELLFSLGLLLIQKGVFWQADCCLAYLVALRNRQHGEGLIMARGEGSNEADSTQCCSALLPVLNLACNYAIFLACKNAFPLFFVARNAQWNEYDQRLGHHRDWTSYLNGKFFYFLQPQFPCLYNGKTE